MFGVFFRMHADVSLALSLFMAFHIPFIFFFSPPTPLIGGNL
jgi:hypothetical protein